MRIRQVLVFALVALFVLVGVAQAAKTTPVISRNTYINTTAEQISSTGGTACKSLRICNARTTGIAKAAVLNSSGLTVSNGIVLWPNASTSSVADRCVDINPVQIGSTITTVDATAWYGIALTGNVTIEMTCIP